MAKTRVLVTGLSGVVGQAMQAELADRYELSSLSRYGTEGWTTRTTSAATSPTRTRCRRRSGTRRWWCTWPPTAA